MQVIIFFITYFFSYSQIENQHQWITYTLLHKLFNNIYRETTKHVQKQQNYIQIIYALRLYKNVTIHLQQVFSNELMYIN